VNGGDKNTQVTEMQNHTSAAYRMAQPAIVLWSANKLWYCIVSFDYKLWGTI